MRDKREARRKGTGILKLQITIDGKTYAAEIEVLDEDASEDLQGDASDSAIRQQPLPPGAYTPSRVAETHSADEKAYQSPVNGLVIRVNVTPGQELKAGDLILVLEAMKMETSITAHHAGRVKSVNAKAGEPVTLHQVLVELE
jgi:methylmalonyl-CoA carboxyltransferase 1.3S subunit